MAQAMKINKARERLFRIEEIHLDKIGAKARDKFVEQLLNQTDEDYSSSRMLTEDDLKKELGSVLG